jgi:hypothetical protein
MCSERILKELLSKVNDNCTYLEKQKSEGH